MYDIGSSSRKFRNVFANSFVGDFNGSFTATTTINGNINGSAAKLVSPTNFSITGDVLSNVISFNGQTQTGTAVFTTTIAQDFVTSKTEATDSLLTDQILIYRSGVSGGLRRTTKQALFQNVATVPIGAVIPFAGTVLPTGFLFCDGSEVTIANYTALYSIIGYTYKPPALLVGKSTFALPDLRGRFGLGRDNMENVDASGAPLTVPSKDNDDDPLTPDITVLAKLSGPANRVTDVTADTLGTGSGSEQRTLNLTNIPDHKHNLNSGVSQYYAAGLPGAGSDPNAVPNLGMPNASTGSGLPNSGNVISAQTGLPFNTMNPYLTMNYIIFTGVLQ
jgi:microcystin-dependent protein